MAMLCQSLRKKLTLLEDGNGSSYLVTAAIPSHYSYTKFNFKLLNESLDYVNMMSYDMNLAGRATHLCPLFKANNDGNVGYGIDQGIKKLLVNLWVQNIQDLELWQNFIICNIKVER